MAIINQDDRAAALERGVQISLFTWRRAGADDRLDDEERYGWWGDSFPSETDDQIGSRIYLLRRRSLTDETVRDAIDYARESVQWMLDDGQVIDVAVTAVRSVNRLDMRLVLTTPDGEQVTVQLDNLWQVIHGL